MSTRGKGWRYLVTAFVVAVLAFVPLFLSGSLIDPFVAGGVSIGGFAAFIKLFGIGFDLVTGKDGTPVRSLGEPAVLATVDDQSLSPSPRPIIVAQPKEEAFGTVFSATEVSPHEESRRD